MIYLRIHDDRHGAEAQYLLIIVRVCGFNSHSNNTKKVAFYHSITAKPRKAESGSVLTVNSFYLLIN